MPTPRAGGGALAQYRGLHVLAGQWVVAGPLPLADVLEHGAAADVPVVQGGDPFGVEHRAAVAAGQCGEGHRSVGRPERRGAQRLDRHAQQFGGDARGDDAGGLALVVSGADSGVPLDVLDRAHAGTAPRGRCRRPSRHAAGRRTASLRAATSGTRHSTTERRTSPPPCWTSGTDGEAKPRSANAPRRRLAPARRQPARSNTPLAAPATVTPRAARRAGTHRGTRRSAACRGPG